MNSVDCCKSSDSNHDHMEPAAVVTELSVIEGGSVKDSQEAIVCFTAHIGAFFVVHGEGEDQNDD